MKTFPRRAAAIATAATTVFGTLAGLSPAIASTFGQKEVEQNRFVAVAAPRGTTAHQLLVVEQVSDARPCWSETGASPVQVDPLLVNFDFTGICGRSTDSNGYSIRMAGQDLGLQYSLRVVNRSGDLVLVGAPNDRTRAELEIGRANGSTPNFAKINLNPGWRFTKRTFGDRTLGHVYLTYDGAPPAAGTPSTGTPSTGTPSTGTPSTGTPSTGTPSTGTPSTGTPARFRDTASDIYAREIEEAVAMGFIAGFAEDNTFRPQVSLTREQLVSIVLEGLVKLPNANLSLPTQANARPFRDVDTTRWSAAKIQFAQANNIVSGYSDGTFRPTQPVTRAELMAVLRRAAEYGRTLRGQNPELQPQQSATTFSDTGSHWAAGLISQMSSYCSVATPVNERGTAFSPNNASQRNYAAAATLRMLNCVKGQ